MPSSLTHVRPSCAETQEKRKACSVDTLSSHRPSTGAVDYSFADWQEKEDENSSSTGHTAFFPNACTHRVRDTCIQLQIIVLQCNSQLVKDSGKAGRSAAVGKGGPEMAMVAA